jgi:uncharacterized protein YggL (DUF469 family)
MTITINQINYDSSNISLEDFNTVLARHDWYYQFSDDARVWRSGQNVSDFINEVIQCNGLEYKDLCWKYIGGLK